MMIKFDNQINIRVARIEDIQSLIKLRAILLDGNHSTIYTSRNAQESNLWKTAYNNWINDLHGSNENIRIVVAECEGQLAGCATGIVDSRPPSPDCITGLCGWVQSVVVLPQWRRRGVAFRIMQDLLSWFEERAVSKVVLESTKEAESLYEKLGFIISPEKFFIYEGNRL
ncbi:GNAT family N-acetyltransferase [Brenneria goodwinii]|uniref:GNAT family N-acetyltransferase n=1 Tax=Brenneria goodwinii TaxID=1109412 RepID=UPI001EFAEFB5|nr:GNAT family N-acetyltransferase [Brenneria bubanii]